VRDPPRAAATQSLLRVPSDSWHVGRSMQTGPRPNVAATPLGIGRGGPTDGTGGHTHHKRHYRAAIHAQSECKPSPRPCSLLVHNSWMGARSCPLFEKVHVFIKIYIVGTQMTHPSKASRRSVLVRACCALRLLPASIHSAPLSVANALSLRIILLIAGQYN
jgi:hypothetical protein